MEMDRGCPGGPKLTVDVQVLSEEGLPPKGFHLVLGLSSPQLPPECTAGNGRLQGASPAAAPVCISQMPEGSGFSTSLTTLAVFAF